MKFNELYYELRKKLEISNDNIDLEKIPDEEKKMLLQLCDSNKKVRLYPLSEEGKVLQIAIWPKE